MPVSHTEHHPQIYDVTFPRSTKRFPCTFPVCPGSSRTCNGLRLHLNSQYWGGSIRILEEHPNPLPRYKLFGSQVPAWKLSTRHCALENFKQGEECRRRRETLQCYFEAGRFLFQINVEALPPSEAFLYLGRKIAYYNSDWLAV